MHINFFDKYEIDFNDIKDKLKVIEQHSTENASFIHHTFSNAIKYLFEPISLNLIQMIPFEHCIISPMATILYFNTITSEEDLAREEWLLKSNISKIVFIGKHKAQVINEKIICLPISHISEIQKIIKEAKEIQIGVNVEAINYEKYYYGRMRSYFLNVLNAFYQLTIEDLKRDVEGICTNILLDENNFVSHHDFEHSNIEMKKMIKIFEKILRAAEANHLRIDEDTFYVLHGELTEIKKAMLNSLSELLWLYKTKTKEEMISYAYDKLALQMQEEVKRLNYCHFIDNQCVTMRYTDNSFPNSKKNGCCNNTYKDKGKNCRYLNEDYSCAICSLSCRVFTCGYLQKRGIDHSLLQYPLMDCVFKRLSTLKIVYGFFTPKEKMMKKLRNSSLKS